MVAAPAPAPCPEPAKRSKRIYVYWGMALALLLALGLFCWLVVVPFLQARAAVGRCGSSSRIPGEIKGLGGPERAAYCLSLYVRLPDRTAGDKATAATMLGSCGEAAVPALARLLGDKNARVRGNAARALGNIGPEAKKAVPALAKLLGDKNADMRCSAASALRRIGPASGSATRELSAALDDDNPDVRRNALLALSNIGPSAAAATGKAQILVSDPNEDMRVAAARAVWKLAGKRREAIVVLRKALKNNGEYAPHNAAEVLGEMGPEAEEAVPDLVWSLSKGNARSRVWVAKALGQIGDVRAVPALKEALGDSSPFVCEAAAEALKKIKAKPEKR